MELNLQPFDKSRIAQRNLPCVARRVAARSPRDWPATSSCRHNNEALSELHRIC